MKKNLFFLFATLFALIIVSCGGNKKALSEQLVGVWAGVDTISIASVDSLGDVNIETIMVPIVVEYFADTTMNAKIRYNDSTLANVTAVVMIGNPYITYEGMMAVNDKKQDIQGELFYTEDPESLVMNFYSENPTSGEKHNGKAVLERQKKVSK